jgi:RNA polymerase sigma-70 factor (ECF subfamily)
MRTANISYTADDGKPPGAHPSGGTTDGLTAGDHLDSAELFRRHAPFVAKFILRMGVPRGDLDDLMQEVFLIAHRNGGYQAGPAKPTTYLANIAFKLVHTERRKRRVRSFVELDDERVQRSSGGGNPERTAEHRQRLHQLDRALSTLDPDKRAVFVLAELEGESVVSIAAGLEIPVDTAYSRLRHARRLFREAVERQDAGEPKTVPVLEQVSR